MTTTANKYLGKVFDGWKVTDRKVAPGGHSIYTLKTKKGLTIKTITVRDNELTKFSAGKTISDELAGKLYQVTKYIRVPQNKVDKKTSLFNLFRHI